MQSRIWTISLSTIDATVAALGSQGDGILQESGTTWFVPFVLPGERVRVHPGGHASAVLEQVLQASPDRAVPPCGLFGRCGGCTLQHMQPAAMRAFKCGLVCDALRQAGFALPATIGFASTVAGSRRRVDLALRRTPTGVLVGLHQRAGGVVDLSECHVLEPRLFALTGVLRPVLLRLGCLRGSGSAIVDMLDSGPDLLLATDAAPDTADRTRLADFAREAGIPRISWRPLKGADGGAETICTIAPVHHALSGARIVPPPGAFLQASGDTEAAIVAAVLAGVPERHPRGGRIVELFAGCGTLSFPLALRGKVLAVEGQLDAAACLRAGARTAPPGTRLEALHRDLARQPLLAKDLARALGQDAAKHGVIVLDPPFGGAGPQMPEIAGSGAARVIMVSCNPKALGQDARMLHAAGYRLEQLTVIDQFLWSSSVESVASFVRPRRP